MDMDNTKPKQAKKSLPRRYSEQFKAQVLAECSRPGASIQAIARKRGVPASVVHNWRYLARRRLAAVGEFVALPIVARPPTGTAPAPISVDGDVGLICIEVQHAAGVIRVRWPLAASAQSVTWLRVLLQ